MQGPVPPRGGLGRFAASLGCALALLRAAPAGAVDAPPVPPATASAPESLKSDGSDADQHRVPHSRPRRATPQQAIDQAVRRMTAALDLDPGQQAALRSALVQERLDIRRVASDEAQAGGSKAERIRAVIDSTREKIRATLNDEQRKKYPGVTPADLLGPTHTDLDYWLRATQARPPEPAGRAVN